MVNLARQPGAYTHIHTYAHMHTHTTRLSPVQYSTVLPLATGLFPPARISLESPLPLSTGFESPIAPQYGARYWSLVCVQALRVSTDVCLGGLNGIKQCLSVVHVLKGTCRELEKKGSANARDIVSGAWLPTHTRTPYA